MVDEVGAGFGQREGHGAAHALGAAGDDGDAAGEVEEIGHACLMCGVQPLTAPAVRPEAYWSTKKE